MTTPHRTPSPDELLWWVIDYGDGITRFEQASFRTMESRPFSSRTWGWTKEEVTKHQGVLDKPCVDCGGLVTTNWMEKTKQRLIAANRCFTCDHWHGYALTKDNPSHHVIDGHHYIVEPDAPKGTRGFVGFGGEQFTIERDGRRIVTHNLWHQGEIPTHWRDRLPDTSCFVRDAIVYPVQCAPSS